MTHLKRNTQLVHLKRSEQPRPAQKGFRRQVKQSDEDYYKFLRERIRAARKERHMTQAELGKAIHKSGVVISDMERGRTEVNAADLMRIAQVLEKPIKYFFPIRDVPSEEELTTWEWELIIQARKLEKHPDLQKLLMDEAKKLGELAQAKEQQIVEMLLEDWEKGSGQNKKPAELEEVRKMLAEAKRQQGKK